MVNAFDDQRTRGTIDTNNESKGIDGSLRLVGHGLHGLARRPAGSRSASFASQFASVNVERQSRDQSHGRVLETLDQWPVSVPATGVGGRFELRPPLGKSIELRVEQRRPVHDDGARPRSLFTSPCSGNPTMNRIAGGDDGSRCSAASSEASANGSPTSFTLTASGRIDRWWIQGWRGCRPSRSPADRRSTASTSPDRSGWAPDRSRARRCRLEAGAAR